MSEERSRDFAAGIMTRYRKKRLQVFVQNVENLVSGKELIELPGGMSEKVDQGNPERTLGSEWEEETGYVLKKNAEPQLVYDEPQFRRPEIKRYYHFWRKDCEGVRRSKKIRDGVNTLFPPYWIDAELLLSKEQFRRSHRRALLAFRTKMRLF
jgi:hypothetical protein